MRFLSTGILLVLCSYGGFSEAGPLGSLQFGSSGIQFGSLQQPQLAESIVDWLRDMKTRIFDNPSALPDLTRIIGTTRDSYEQQKKFLDKLIVDMSNVAFNPEKDWGFRLGHWYLIRKESDDVMSSFWNLVRPRSPPESTTGDSWLEFDFDKTDIPSSFNTIIPIEPTTVEEKIPETTGSRDSKDNETNDPSAEVIAPNDS
ncbi:uncharacterized protein LOC107042717 [Diachasma alloeum]|uniref:uncharacterized protein LOC107042717 n=1 Tax=Diachasma alloeum TaxID=454923 RepID=UPI000738301F|nr:uncharacterized protein LOC107042717 [Diachasma alloeum]